MGNCMRKEESDGHGHVKPSSVVPEAPTESALSPLERGGKFSAFCHEDEQLASVFSCVLRPPFNETCCPRTSLLNFPNRNRAASTDAVASPQAAAITLDDAVRKKSSTIVPAPAADDPGSPLLGSNGTAAADVTAAPSSQVVEDTREAERQWAVDAARNACAAALQHCLREMPVGARKELQQMRLEIDVHVGGTQPQPTGTQAQPPPASAPREGATESKKPEEQARSADSESKAGFSGGGKTLLEDAPPSAAGKPMSEATPGDVAKQIVNNIVTKVQEKDLSTQRPKQEEG